MHGLPCVHISSLCLQTSSLLCPGVSGGKLFSVAGSESLCSWRHSSPGNRVTSSEALQASGAPCMIVPLHIHLSQASRLQCQTSCKQMLLTLHWACPGPCGSSRACDSDVASIEFSYVVLTTLSIWYSFIPRPSPILLAFTNIHGSRKLQFFTSLLLPYCECKCKVKTGEVWE